MVQIFGREMTVMGTHGQHGKAVGQIAVRVLVDGRHLIPVQQPVGGVVSVDGADFASLVDDAGVVDFLAGRRLKISPARIAAFRTAKNPAQKGNSLLTGGLR